MAGDALASINVTPCRVFRARSSKNRSGPKSLFRDYKTPLHLSSLCSAARIRRRDFGRSFQVEKRKDPFGAVKKINCRPVLKSDILRGNSLSRVTSPDSHLPHQRISAQMCLIILTQNKRNCNPFFKVFSVFLRRAGILKKFFYKLCRQHLFDT